MTYKTLFLSLLILIAALALAACGGAAPEPASTPISAAAATVPAPTKAPEPTDASVPTSVPAPTDSAVSTDTPQPSPTPEPVEPAADTETSPLPTPEALPQKLRAFDIDAENSEVRYEAKEEFFSGAVERMGKALGLFNAIGVTNAIAGGFVLSEGNPPQIEMSQFEVDLSTLASDDNRRDRQVRSNYLETDQYPLAEFSATGVEGFPQSYDEGEEISFQLVGDMTIHGTTQPAIWDVTATLDGNTLTGAAQTVVMLSDYGIESARDPQHPYRHRWHYGHGRVQSSGVGAVTHRIKDQRLLSFRRPKGGEIPLLSRIIPK